MRAEIVFEVPESGDDCILIFDASPVVPENIRVGLGFEPTSVAIAPDLLLPNPYLGRIGETITQNDVALTVLEYGPPAAESVAPPKGFRYVIVRFTVANLGNQAVRLPGLNDMMLLDSLDRRFSAAPRIYVSDQLTNPFDEIAPGEQATGTVVFQAAEDSAGLVLALYPNLFSMQHTGEGIFVALDSRP